MEHFNKRFNCAVYNWVRVEDKLPPPFFSVYITDDNGIHIADAYRIYSDTYGDIWTDDNGDYYEMNKYNKWCYNESVN